MKTRTVIIGLVFIGITGLVVGSVIYNKSNKVSDGDFDAIISLSKNKGYDIFDLPVERLSITRYKYLKNFNRKYHNQFLELLQKGEKNWTPNDKDSFNKLFNKLK